MQDPRDQWKVGKTRACGNGHTPWSGLSPQSAPFKGFRDDAPSAWWTLQSLQRCFSAIFLLWSSLGHLSGAFQEVPAFKGTSGSDTDFWLDWHLRSASTLATMDQDIQTCTYTLSETHLGHRESQETDNFSLTKTIVSWVHYKSLV